MLPTLPTTRSPQPSSALATSWASSTLASLKAWDQAECLLALPRDLGTIAMTETVKGYLRRQNDAELAKRRAADVVRGAVIADWSCPKKP